MVDIEATGFLDISDSAFNEHTLEAVTGWALLHAYAQLIPTVMLSAA